MRDRGRRDWSRRRGVKIIFVHYSLLLFTQSVQQKDIGYYGQTVSTNPYSYSYVCRARYYFLTRLKNLARYLSPIRLGIELLSRIVSDKNVPHTDRRAILSAFHRYAERPLPLSSGNNPQSQSSNLYFFAGRTEYYIIYQVVSTLDEPFLSQLSRKSSCCV